MIVRAYSRHYIEKLIAKNSEAISLFPCKNWHLISIYEEEPVANIESLTELGCKSILALSFWDISDKEYPALHEIYPFITLFTEQQALEIIEYLQRIVKLYKGDDIIVHCKAGISRSGAIATFANDFFELEKNDFYINNPQIIPNAFILSLLRKVLRNNIENDSLLI